MFQNVVGRYTCTLWCSVGLIQSLWQSKCMCSCLLRVHYWSFDCRCDRDGHMITNIVITNRSLCLARCPKLVWSSSYSLSMASNVTQKKEPDIFVIGGHSGTMWCLYSLKFLKYLIVWCGAKAHPAIMNRAQHGRKTSPHSEVSDGHKAMVRFCLKVGCQLCQSYVVVLQVQFDDPTWAIFWFHVGEELCCLRGRDDRHVATECLPRHWRKVHP